MTPLFTPEDLQEVRLYTDKDPYHYTIDNRPLQDLDENIRAVAGALPGMFASYLKALGYDYLGEYELGPYTLTSMDQVVMVDNRIYQPKSFTLLPFSTINDWGIDEAKFSLIGGDELRSDLSKATGASIVGVSGSTPGSVLRSVQDKTREYVTIGDKGGIGDGSYDNTIAVNAALNDRINGWAMVRFTRGTWRIASQIRLRSKTVIYLEPGAEILHSAPTEMLFINGEAGNTNYATGYGGDGDIYFLGSGGVVNIAGSDGYKGMARFAHARNIWVQGLTIKNGYRAHNIEFNSCSNFKCEWNNFEDHLSPAGETNFETIQIDHATSGGLPEFGAADLTPCVNGWIRNNTFKNVWSAFGSHSDPDPAVGMHDNIHFDDNVISGFRGMPFKLQGFTNGSALRNVMTGAGSTARGPVIWSSRNIDAGFGSLDMAGATSLGWTVGNSSVTYLSEDVTIHDTIVLNAVNNPIFYANCTRGEVRNNILRNCSKSVYMSTAIDIRVHGNRHDLGSPAYLVEMAATALRISVERNSGPFTTARYNTASYLTEIDGETLITSVLNLTTGSITLNAPINDYATIMVGTGSTSAGTFRSQFFRGFTTVGFEVNSKIVVNTASGVMTLNVDSSTALTITSNTGTEAIRFIYGIKRR